MIFIAGSTGFVGVHLLEALRRASIRARCLVRNEEKAEWVTSFGFEAAIGDITSPASLRNVLTGVDTVIHLVGIIEEKGERTFENVHVNGTDNLVNEAVRSGIQRIFYQSALGSDIDSPFGYLRTKAEAERIVRSSNIPYTIFRPSLIVGRGDGFTEKMKQLISAGPVVPVPGGGSARFQPIYIKDWTGCFLKILRNADAVNRIYEFGGPEHISYTDILRRIMEAMNVKKPIVHIPMNVMRLSLPFMGVIGPIARVLGKNIPAVSGDLLSLLTIDNICEIDSVEKQFGFIPTRFSEALAEFLE